MSFSFGLPQALLRQPGQVYLIRLLRLPDFSEAIRWANVVLGAIQAETGRALAFCSVVMVVSAEVVGVVILDVDDVRAGGTAG